MADHYARELRYLFLPRQCFRPIAIPDAVSSPGQRWASSGRRSSLMRPKRTLAGSSFGLAVRVHPGTPCREWLCDISPVVVISLNATVDRANELENLLSG
jgi:hypothetical protein